LLRVTAGWVSLQSKGRESMAPAGAMCYARPPQGPGTPFFEDASGKFRQALEQFDFAGGGAPALTIVLAEARPRDGLSLFSLLQSVAEADKERVYERLVALVPLPEGVTRVDVLEQKNPEKLSQWREKIEYISVGIDPSLVPKNTGTLHPTGTLNKPRYVHTATLLNDERVLVAGGLERDGVALDSTEIYDPATGQFTLAGRLTTKRVGHTATLLNDGRVLITGGSDNTFYFGALASAEIYDPRTNSFRAVGSMHAVRLAHRATLLPDGKVLITGGQDKVGNKLDTAELYDPVTEGFTVISSMHANRDDHTATLLKSGLVLIVGGGSRREPDEGPLASAELYDPIKQRFVVTGSMSVLRYKHSAAMLPDGRVLVMGGSDARMWSGRYASAEIYDPATGKFTAAANLNTARYKIRDAVVTLPNGRILIAGGGARPEVFDPATGIFAPVAGSIGATRYYATATLLKNGEVLILGGYVSGSQSQMAADLSAWLYKP
ncbi:MAG TPA: kelch repeat-containing protein, partial [Blastocatellia bacterium]|nr:kelch repeat-containing protein [Blastocatellia bacterium]